jgi:DNA-binding SARP family transcriptional activator/tetratricopeptide (TPR) repeat protein
MEFRILGPLYADAGSGSTPAVISQPLLQSALAVLLLRANRPCPRGFLIEALWAGDLPGEPEAALRVCMSRLRRRLGGCSERLESVGPPGGSSPGHRQQRGYRMLVRPGELDVHEFTDLAEQGQSELDSGNPAAAADYLVQALALWGDPPLPDLPASEVLAPAIAMLRNQRRAVADTLIDARLAAGEHDRVLGQLRAAVLAAPGRERTCAQLMTACHALGLRREALDVFQAARQASLDQQGAEPGQALALLYRQILAEELASPGRGSVRAGPRGRGGGSRGPGGPQAPAPPPDFTGRTTELAGVLSCLKSPGTPIVVLTGGPGSGKTALACVAAEQLREHFGAGQLYVELGGLSRPQNPQQVLAGLLQTLGVSAGELPADLPARAAMFRALVGSQKVLLVADNAVSAAQVRPLLPGPGGAAVLVTSRGRLAGLAGARITELGGLPDGDARSLLASVAGPERVRGSGEQADPDDPAADIVAACGGLPLALRLAGTTLASRPGLTVTRLAADLQSERLLEVLAADDVSVREAIGSSFSAVSDRARSALRLAAIAVPDDFPGWALTELADGDVTVTGQLTAAGLISPAAAEVAGPRFRCHPLTRAYARDCQPGSPDPATRDRAALTRLSAAWLRRAEWASTQVPALPFLVRPGRLDRSRLRPAGEPGGLAAAPGRDWLDCEGANLLAATVQACAREDWPAARALALRQLAVQCLTGRHGEAAQTWLLIGTADAAAGREADAAAASYYRAVALTHDEHRLAEAAALLARSALVLGRSGDPAIAAAAYGLLGSCANRQRRHAAAIRASEQALRLAGSDPGGSLVRCGVRAVLGETFARIGRESIGRAYCQRAVREALELGESAVEAFARRALSAALAAGDQATRPASRASTAGRA